MKSSEYLPLVQKAIAIVAGAHSTTGVMATKIAVLTEAPVLANISVTNISWVAFVTADAGIPVIIIIIVASIAAVSFTLFVPGDCRNAQQANGNASSNTPFSFSGVSDLQT